MLRRPVFRVILCILLAASTAVAVYMYVQNRNNTDRISAIENDLNAARDEIASVEQEVAQKDSELESYSALVDEQNSVFESEKNELNEKISELNKQIALKRQREAEAAAAFIEECGDLPITVFETSEWTQ